MIYLDNAATSFPKPESVYSEVSRCMREYCGNPGRGSHYMARAASEKLFSARDKLCTMFNAPSPENVIFTLNTTYALNMAIKSYVKAGDHILISDLEHNSVLRCVDSVCEKAGATYTVFRTFSGCFEKILKELNNSLRSETRLVVCIHASNICGTVLPIEKIGMFCKSHGLYFIADAAQSAGIFDIDVQKFNINALCVPSHKGLLGPQGIAALILNGNFADKLKTFVEGGSGTDSQRITMPPFLPDKFEAGTMPTPAAAGLCEGIDFVLKCGIQNLRYHESSLARAVMYDLMPDKNFIVYSGNISNGILLFNIKGVPSSEVAELLDRYGICTRSGFHCAPLAHRTLNTGESGAVRISFGVFNTQNDARAVTDCLYRIKKELL